MAIISILRLLSFTIALRLELFFRGKYIFIKILTLLGIIILAIVYAYAFSIIIVQQNLESENIGKIWFVLNILTFCLLTFRNIFPFFKTKSELISRLYPITPFVRIFVDFVYEIISYSHAFVIFFFASMVILSSQFKVGNVINSILIILLSYLMEKMLRVLFNSISENGKRSNVGRFLLSVILLITSHFWIYFQMPQLWIINIAYLLNFMAMFLIYYQMENNYLEERSKNVDQYTGSFWNYTIISIYLKNKAAFNALIIVIIVKVSILIFVTFAISLKKDMPIFVYNFWLTISPVTLFTYIHNNSFGYFGNLFYSIELHKGSVIELLIIYTKLLVVPLIFDALIFFLFTIINSRLLLSSILFYLFSIIILALSGFQFSIRRYCLIDNNITFKNTTSLLGVLVSFSVVTMLYLTKSNQLYFFVCIFIFSIIGYFNMRSLKKVYSRRKYLICDKLLINPR